MAEVVDKIDWKEAEDVKIFFAIIYPYCDVSHSYIIQIK